MSPAFWFGFGVALVILGIGFTFGALWRFDRASMPPVRSTVQLNGNPEIIGEQHGR